MSANSSKSPVGVAAVALSSTVLAGFQEDIPPGARLNHAVEAPFEPGSVFKVITLAAALENTNLRPESIIPCGNGVINLFGRRIKDHDAYSALSMSDVLAKSSNVGMSKLALQLEPKQIWGTLNGFGAVHQVHWSATR